MQIPKIKLDKSSSTPLYVQLSEALLKQIAQGKLLPDTKLPSIRQMAQALDVNNTTVISAYKNLEHKTAVYSVVGSGTYVAQPTKEVEPDAEPEMETPLTEPEPLELPANIDGFINFADASIDGSLFPVTAFRRAFDSVLERDGSMAFECHDARGYKPLRESLCQLMDGISVKTTPDCIQVVPGVQQALEALAKIILQPGDAVFVEGPAYLGAVAAFFSKRVQIIEMPLAKDGPDFTALEALLEKHKPKLFYVTPNFQTPTGISYSAESKQRLLELAYAHDAYIVEEDQVNDIYYDGIKRTPLKAQDTGDKVIYIKSFSKILAPGLNMGFMACPSHIADEMAKGGIVMAGYMQRAFDVYLRSGAFEFHAANVRSVYGRRYHKLVSAVNTYLSPLADFVLPAGGLSLWITPHKAPGDEDYAARFLQQNVIVSPGRLYALAGGDEYRFRISFAAVPEEKIAEGIGVIAAVLAGDSGASPEI